MSDRLERILAHLVDGSFISSAAAIGICKAVDYDTAVLNAENAQLRKELDEARQGFIADKIVSIRKGARRAPKRFALGLSKTEPTVKYK